MKRIAAIALVSLMLIPAAFADGDYGQPGEFLNWGAGARSLALGRAFTALADDASAVYYNPAGLGLQNPLQITLQHAFLFVDTIYDYAAVIYPVSGIGTFGASWVRLGSTGFDSRDMQWASSGTFGIVNEAFVLSYGRELFPWISIGANMKLIHEAVFNDSGLGYGADVGVMWLPADFINVGLSVINAVPASVKLNTTAENFPITLKFGVAFKLLSDRLVPVFDFEKAFANKDFKFRMGIEGYPIQNLALRAGLDETEFSFGAGYFLRPVRVDYAIAMQELGMSHRVSVTLAFGGFDINLAAEPKIFSPVGTKKSTTISIYAVTKNPIAEWELNVINEDGDVVRTYSGDDNPPASVMWNGKDDRGLPAGDGEYKFTMTVKDKNGRVIESNMETVKISSSVPMQPGSIKLEE
ncbi:MAG: PorV/PorQ family protein [Spirochaetia bacterium]|nr:PorV/PorQ family protein [Spirochaetia bacterium]